MNPSRDFVVSLACYSFSISVRLGGFKHVENDYLNGDVTQHIFLNFSELKYERKRFFFIQLVCFQSHRQGSGLKFKYIHFFFFDNWVKSGILYIANRFDRNWCFRPLDEFTIIKDKSNWLCEYKILLLATKSIRKIYFLMHASHSNKPNATNFTSL